MACCAGCGKKFNAGEKAVEASAYFLYCAGCVVEVRVMGYDGDTPVVVHAPTAHVS